MPAKAMQSTCGAFSCQLAYGTKVAAKLAQKRAKAERIAARENRKVIRLKRESLKTRRDYIKEAQLVVNAYVRERDKNEACISCGCSLESVSVGGGFDAGHYRSRGACQHLRFDERNIHGQCKRCNRWLNGNVANFRIGLVDRFGDNFVEAIEADNQTRKHSIEELKDIIAVYREKTRMLKSI
jgi:hypothetical protein